MDSIPGQGTKIPRTVARSKKKKGKKVLLKTFREFPGSRISELNVLLHKIILLKEMLKKKMCLT